MNTRIDKAVLRGLHAEQWQMIKSLRGGYSQASVCLIEVNDQQFIIKLDDVSQKHLGLDRSYAAYAIAAENNLAPKVYYANAEEGIVLMQHVVHQPLPPRTPQFVKDIAGVIRQLHAGPAFGAWLTPLAIVRYVCDQMPSILKENTLIKTAISMLPAFEEMLNDPADRRPCHGDLNPSNILYDGERYLLVDWASASQNNLYFDLACCASFAFAHHDELAEALLQEYLGREPDNSEIKKYASMRLFAKLFYGLVIVATACRDGYQCNLSEGELAELPAFKHLYSKVLEGSEDFANTEVRFKLGAAFLNQAVSCQLLLNDELAVVTKPRF